MIRFHRATPLRLGSRETQGVFLKHNSLSMSHAGVRDYERTTREIVSRFISHGLTFPDCISALDAALTKLQPRLKDGQLPALRVMMLANLARVNFEMEQRGPAGSAARA